MQQTDYTQRRRLAAPRGEMILIPVTGEIIQKRMPTQNYGEAFSVISLITPLCVSLRNVTIKIYNILKGFW